jgi:Zn-dependent membrane protease YugP
VHDVGHAVQDGSGYLPMKVRGSLAPAANWGTRLGYACFIGGILPSVVNLVWAGIILFSGAALFALVTIPVEFNTSSKAPKMLKTNGLVSATEDPAAGTVLSAAAHTYVAGLLQAVSSLPYYIFVATGVSRGERPL